MKKELVAALLNELVGVPEEPTGLPFEVGKSYFLRTVTYHLTGRVTAIKGGFLVLADAAWIAESGRFADFLKTGLANEVEPVGEAMVSIGSITDAFPWPHKLPRDQK